MLSNRDFIKLVCIDTSDARFPILHDISEGTVDWISPVRAVSQLDWMKSTGPTIAKPCIILVREPVEETQELHVGKLKDSIIISLRRSNKLDRALYPRTKWQASFYLLAAFLDPLSGSAAIGVLRLAYCFALPGGIFMTKTTQSIRLHCDRRNIVLQFRLDVIAVRAGIKNQIPLSLQLSFGYEAATYHMLFVCNILNERFTTIRA